MGSDEQPRSVGGEYRDRGDYHRAPDPRWPYYPVYVAKLRYVRKFLNWLPTEARILDAGCGEGVLVEEYRGRGYAIEGLDASYESDVVRRGDVTSLPYPDSSFDVVLCLDVLEHLPFVDQDRTIREFNRVLAPGGTLLVTVPNLAHLASRLSFLFAGRLIRTSAVERHPGDRPLAEYRALMERAGFTVERVRGFFPTFPLVSLATRLVPRHVGPWHRFLNATLAYPGWCFLSCLVCRKRA